jgi:hypothetical protein
VEKAIEREMEAGERRNALVPSIPAERPISRRGAGFLSVYSSVHLPLPQLHSP